MKLLISAYAVTAPELSGVVEEARTIFDTVVLNPLGRRPKPEELLELWDGADAIICGMEPFNADMLAQAPKTLKAICRFGVGYDAIDCDAARRAGIAVCNTPGANSAAVADMALCLILGLARHLPQHDAATRRGMWKRFNSNDLEHKTLGIVGFGAIGRLVARRAAGFGMKLLAYDPYLAAQSDTTGVEQVELEELFQRADFITLHAPHTAETHHLVDARMLERMKPTAYLINTSRGELVDEQALAAALVRGAIAGAGLDVFEREPLYESPLFALDNVILTPHQAANTLETSVRMARMALENAAAVCAGRPCRYIVNR